MRTVTIDAVDHGILDARTDRWSQRPGPRVGDFVRFADGTVRRFSHDWDEHGLQTSDGGSFYLGDGYMSFSGSLYSSIPRESLTDTGETMPGSCWFFHHDWHRAHNGIDVVVACRVFECDMEPNR